MPTVKVKGGYKASKSSTKVHRTKEGAERQLSSIKANKYKKK